MHTTHPIPAGDDADLAEQATPVTDIDDAEPGPAPLARAWDADLADALEQSIPVPVPEEPTPASRECSSTLTERGLPAPTSTTGSDDPAVVWPDPNPLTPWWSEVLGLDPAPSTVLDRTGAEPGRGHITVD